MFCGRQPLQQMKLETELRFLSKVLNEQHVPPDCYGKLSWEAQTEEGVVKQKGLRNKDLEKSQPIHIPESTKDVAEQPFVRRLV